jgi:hypothetical protein
MGWRRSGNISNFLREVTETALAHVIGVAYSPETLLLGSERLRAIQSSMYLIARESP